MKKIFHITDKKFWNGKEKEYTCDTSTYKTDDGSIHSFESDGFIPCATREQVIDVANHLFKGKNDLIVLVIDESKVHAQIKYENPGNGKLYPRIYGPLNTDAVISVDDLKTDKDGLFVLPDVA